MGAQFDIIKSINEAVYSGGLDERGLLTIANHVREVRKDMRRQKGAEVAAQIDSGAKVRIKHDASLRPTYILGVEATVVTINRTTATIKLGEVQTPMSGGRNRFFTGQMIRCPLDAIELV